MSIVSNARLDTLRHSTSLHRKELYAFLETTWQKQTVAKPRRGLTSDGTSVPEASRLTAARKHAQLDLLLRQIAKWCPVISSNSIVKHSTFVSVIRQKIRKTLRFPIHLRSFS